jgi:hypothetical protein
MDGVGILRLPKTRGGAMPKYRIVFLTSEGLLLDGSLEVECDGDDDAMDCAAEIEHPYVKEVWLDQCLVGSFPQKTGLEFGQRSASVGSE